MAAARTWGSARLTSFAPGGTAATATEGTATHDPELPSTLGRVLGGGGAKRKTAIERCGGEGAALLAHNARSERTCGVEVNHVSRGGHAGRDVAEREAVVLRSRRGGNRHAAAMI